MGGAVCGTALEAHAAGCAVISATSGGLPEINADNALTLPADFDAADVADRLKTLMADDAALRRSLAQRGLAHCKKQFSLENVSASADDFYDQITRVKSELSIPAREVAGQDLPRTGWRERRTQSDGRCCRTFTNSPAGGYRRKVAMLKGQQTRLGTKRAISDNLLR